jgi:hypothetical protein
MGIFTDLLYGCGPCIGQNDCPEALRRVRRCDGRGLHGMAIYTRRANSGEASRFLSLQHALATGGAASPCPLRLALDKPPLAPNHAKIPITLVGSSADFTPYASVQRATMLCRDRMRPSAHERSCVDIKGLPSIQYSRLKPPLMEVMAGFGHWIFGTSSQRVQIVIPVREIGIQLTGGRFRNDDSSFRKLAMPPL